MGLFDNLFLDQNTPVTINDGVDHSKDVVTHMVDPDEPSGPGAPHDGKNDNSISDLFASDKKEESAAEVTLNPEPPKDIALEIGSAPTNESAIAPLDPSMAPAEFDIGGDLSFDTLPDTSVITDASAPDITEVVADPIGLSLPAVGDPPPAELSGTFLTGGAEPGADTPAEGAAPIEGSTPIEGAPPAVQEETKVETTPPAPGELGGAGGIFGLIDSNTDAAPAVDAIPPVDPTASAPILETAKTEIASGVTPGLNMSAGGGTFSNMGNMSAESILGRDALALFSQGGQTSSLLRDKLNNFIEELKVLHSRDQSQRYHKLEQIAMYEERIREIDAEAANRKRVLQAEIDDLKRQVEMMDREKNDIQEVISTFHKDVGTN